MHCGMASLLPTPILMQIYGEKIVMADDSAIGTILMVKTKGDDKNGSIRGF